MKHQPSSTSSTLEANEPRLKDYSLLGRDSVLAVEKGLAEAQWYHSDVPRDKMRELLERRDGPGLRDTALWFALIFASAIAGYLLWGSAWAILPFAIYGVLYGSTSDSRWHESGHGTVFKTDWLNNVLYEIASFMVMRESVRWRWSHTRHHSDTLIVGRDPEIGVPCPPHFLKLVLVFFGLPNYQRYAHGLLFHCVGKMLPEELTYIPPHERPKLFFRARVYLLIYAAIVGAAIVSHSILPLVYTILTPLYGAWLMSVYAYTQHSSLAENVLDHRLNCRTFYTNPVNRFLYLSMNYHVEHHMFPLIPYYTLAKLHALIKDDCPPAYPSLIAAWREMIPAVLRQAKDPTYFIRRPLPEPRQTAAPPQNSHVALSAAKPAEGGWVEVCAAEALAREDVLRFDCAGQTYAIYRTLDDAFHATEGFCTHGQAHLAEGLIKGTLIECPKHNGRFEITDGSPRRAPACVALKTHAVRVTGGKIFLNLAAEKGRAATTPQTAYAFRVTGNANVATFIKELILEHEDPDASLRYRPGEYLQLDIPAYGEISFGDFEIPPPYAQVWRDFHLFDLKARNDAPTRRNYSLATHPRADRQLRFNVRLSTPPPGEECPPGVGSAYLFSLKPGDRVTAIGPFGDFHIKPADGEMVYLGRGSGMAPLRSHIAHLFETLQTARRVSFWYGAHSAMDLYYRDYFEDLARRHGNFTFHAALSKPLPGDHWQGRTGPIQEVLKRDYLDGHPDPAAIEYYLCGSPALIQASLKMLADLKVDPSRIAYDEFS